MGGANWHAYVYNDPVNFVDPEALCAEEPDRTERNYPHPSEPEPRPEDPVPQDPLSGPCYYRSLQNAAEREADTNLRFQEQQRLQEEHRGTEVMRDDYTVRQPETVIQDTHEELTGERLPNVEMDERQRKLLYYG